MISANIMEELSAWAEKNENKSIFPEISKEEVSYYLNRVNKEVYIMEYSIKNIEELAQMLEQYSGLADTPHILKALSVAISQNRFRKAMKVNVNEDGEKKQSTQDGKKVLPEYVYVF